MIFLKKIQLAAKDNEIQRLLDELSHQLEEYQNLMDTKIALDMEIAVFRRLLESEEDRLGISIDGAGMCFTVLHMSLTYFLL